MKVGRIKEPLPPYKDAVEHLSDELELLDLLIRMRVDRFRAEGPSARDPGLPATLYVSDAEVDALLEPRPSGAAAADGETARRCGELGDKIRSRVDASLDAGVALPLPTLAHLFRISPFEAQALVICLAPELDRKYDLLFAYLQDDLTRKKPSVDLVLDLLCDDPREKWRMRGGLSDGSVLFRAGILTVSEDAQSPSGSSGLARFLKLDERILLYLLGNPLPDARLLGKIEWLQPEPGEAPFLDAELLKQVEEIATSRFQRPPRGRGHPLPRLVLHFQGPEGAGKRTLARWICGKLGCPLLSVDLDLLLADARDGENPFLGVFREGLLLQAAVYLYPSEALTRDSARPAALAKRLAGTLKEFGWLTFLGGENQWQRDEVFADLAFHALTLPRPDRDMRREAWRSALKRDWPESDADERDARSLALAGQFRLTPGRIHRASHGLHADFPRDLPPSDRFLAACREQVAPRLGDLAVRLDTRMRWENLVLSDEKSRHLREICEHVRHSQRVFGDWGFEGKITYGKGVSVLFCGPPGTGKTLAAQVIAGELGLDLFKIDLAGVVSKYIGETEKNLQRVFKEAEGGSSILFFDEADSLFGKRTDVSDAHDRYANIETSFLLQKMEEYDGMVILASNLRDNMDEAFVRRIRFIVDFSFPEAADRESIWRAHMPAKAPLGGDVDYAFLARQFTVAGGNIKNIVLNAAFLAAGNGGAISMRHLVQGAKREYEKIGKLWSDRMFAAAGLRGDAAPADALRSDRSVRSVRSVREGGS